MNKNLDTAGEDKRPRVKNIGMATIKVEES